jgi:mannose-6-phosphate isomerase-like protein (cupin superfamily)
MRRFVTGINEAGRSCFVAVDEVVPGPVGGAGQPDLAILWATGDAPPPARPVQTGHHTPLQLTSGAVRMFVVEHGPGTPEAQASAHDRLHHQDALDLIVMLDGTTRMVLDDDERDLEAGDVCVMNGVDHVTVPGPEGCRMVVVSVGTPPPS